MTKAQHTPKPQIQRFNPVDGEFFIVCNKAGKMIGKAFDLENARLIAAAPELLEALEEFALLDWSMPQTAISHNLRIAEKARAAIANAKGYL